MSGGRIAFAEATDFNPGLVGQVYVQGDQIWFFRHTGQSLVAATSFDHVVADVAKRPSYRIAKRIVVIDHQNTRFVGVNASRVKVPHYCSFFSQWSGVLFLIGSQGRKRYPRLFESRLEMFQGELARIGVF